jgi:hypothetical protein
LAGKDCRLVRRSLGVGELPFSNAAGVSFYEHLADDELEQEPFFLRQENGQQEVKLRMKISNIRKALVLHSGNTIFDQ